MVELLVGGFLVYYFLNKSKSATAPTFGAPTTIGAAGGCTSCSKAAAIPVAEAIPVAASPVVPVFSGALPSRYAPPAQQVTLHPILTGAAAPVAISPVNSTNHIYSVMPWLTPRSA